MASAPPAPLPSAAEWLATTDSLRQPRLPPELRPSPPWAFDVGGKISASQAAYSNWTEGGLNTLALALALDGQAVRATPTWKQTHKAALAIGFIQRDTLSIRKANDRLHLSSNLQYRGSGFFKTFNPTLAAGLRTQFISGFNYTENPYPDEREPPIKVSDFFSPATFTQSIGLTYEPEPWINQRLSLGTQEVIVAAEQLRVLYNLARHQSVRYEAGLESETELDREVFKNVQVQSSLRLFAAFNRDSPDMVWENLVSLEFNKWLSVDFELTALYDSDVTRALQVREVLSVGASVKMI